MSIKFGKQEVPEDYEYNLKCKVQVATKTWREEADDFKQHSARVVLLIPDWSSGQCTAFLNAWLPLETDDLSAPQHHEIVMEIGHPVFGPCRGAVMRRNKMCDRPHIFVMSTGAEEVLRALEYKDDDFIYLTVLPQDRDEAADAAQTINRTVK